MLVGGFARVIQGADELTQGADITPSLREENLRGWRPGSGGLERAARVPPQAPAGGADRGGEEVIPFQTSVAS